MLSAACRAPACATLLTVTALLAAAPPDDASPKPKIETVLALQKALQEGRDQMQRGNHQAAVYILEREIARADGYKEYLQVLAMAYRGYVRELTRLNRHAEAATYQDRLEILDPGARLERPAVATPVAAALPPLNHATAVPDKAPPTLAAMAGQNPDKAAALPPAPTPADGSGPPKVGRGTSHPRPEDDPFAETNRAAGKDARRTLEQAEQEFARNAYPAACALYEQAQRGGERLPADCGERWAYCKMYGVAKTVEQGNLSAAAARQLEGEVRSAMDLSPKFQGWGQGLLRNIQERSRGGDAPAVGAEPAAKVVVSHSAGVAETTNFRVRHNASPEVAEKAARIAEATRAAMGRKWFGGEAEPWAPKCELHLHATAQEYAKATGAPAGSPGHSTIRREGERILSRRVDVRLDDPNALTGVLPHETTHAVLAGRFGPFDVPRWADEGMAVLTEPRERVEKHLRNLPAHARDNQLFRVGQLMGMNDYPSPQMVGPFYAQSVSLVDYLCKLKDPPTFARFVKAGLQGGYEPALQQHYGIASFRELEQRWRQASLGDEPLASGR